ncbi:MAG: alpha/beta hydrolase [Candidatus Mesenet longicola]|uniref:Alpha/beta hydrolase n=1 Tax=Candidatus Mesenet longicola TaxID=1892558 RepID=A0A8J3HUM4_9RICK|nr:MAG: alpha/beta hydrolase [Candidatus Mesenet longicola]GHM59230.1 MAG: alpha/beta hydrolase [Candidatus Mesenet longicola]
MVEVFFNSSAPIGDNSTRRIEGIYHQSKDVNAPLALVLPSHPRYGGNMNNKVVCNLFDAFANNDITVLKINFRDVGKQASMFNRGIDELSDAAAAMDWLQDNNVSTVPFWVAGFSFGAWVAMQLMMRRPEVERFVSIAPSANQYDFSFLFPCPVPGLIIQGDRDNISEEVMVSQLAEKLISSMNSEYMQYHVIDGADHFFHDNMGEINKIIDDYVKAWLNNVSTVNKNNFVKRARRKTRQPA